MTFLSTRVQKIKPSATLAVAAKAVELQQQGKDIINLSIGEPDFDTPKFIKEAAIKAIERGDTKYTHSDGTLALREAIIRKFKRDQNISYTPKQILVSTGAKQSIYNLMCAVLNVGDEVLIPAPSWVSYFDMALLCEATPKWVPTQFANRLKLTAEELAKHITPKTKLLMLNSPSNPTGVAYTRDELKALAEVLLDHPQVLICSDDIYEKTLFASEFVNILMTEPKLYERTILVNGVSKAYAMTGWRLGYAGGPPEIISAMAKIQSQSTSNACSISQAAALAALEDGDTSISPMVQAFKTRHDYLLDQFKQLQGFNCLPADGAFYLFVEVSGAMRHFNCADDIAFSSLLLEKAGLAVVPGSAFGAPNFIRLSYATSMAQLEKAVARLKALVSA